MWRNGYLNFVLRSRSTFASWRSSSVNWLTLYFLTTSFAFLFHNFISFVEGWFSDQSQNLQPCLWIFWWCGDVCLRCFNTFCGRSRLRNHFRFLFSCVFKRVFYPDAISLFVFFYLKIWEVLLMNFNDFSIHLFIEGKISMFSLIFFRVFPTGIAVKS